MREEYIIYRATISNKDRVSLLDPDGTNIWDSIHFKDGFLDPISKDGKRVIAKLVLEEVDDDFIMPTQMCPCCLKPLYEHISLPDSREAWDGTKD